MTKYSFEINLGETESLKRTKKASLPALTQIKQISLLKSIFLHQLFGIY